MANTYYVYSLKDPREKPAKIFYVGKGTGSCATEHILQRDNTRKGKFIQDLLQLGIIPIVSKIATDLTEVQALQIELALIGTFGTLDSGGPLLNTVIPKTIKRKIDNKIIVPVGSVEKAQLGLQLMKDSISLLAEEVANSDYVHFLSLQPDNTMVIF
jgi:hypothetical protein